MCLWTVNLPYCFDTTWRADLPEDVGTTLTLTSNYQLYTLVSQISQICASTLLGDLSQEKELSSVSSFGNFCISLKIPPDLGHLVPQGF